MNKSLDSDMQPKAFWNTVGILANAAQQMPATWITNKEVFVKTYSTAQPFELKSKNTLDFSGSIAHLKCSDARLSHRSIPHGEPTAARQATPLPHRDGQWDLPLGQTQTSAQGRAQGPLAHQRPRSSVPLDMRHGVQFVD